MTEQTVLTFDPEPPTRRRVTFETLDGRAVSFTRPERQDGLTPKQQAALNGLFAWLDQQDRDWTDRVRRGDIAPRTCAGCPLCRNDQP